MNIFLYSLFFILVYSVTYSQSEVKIGNQIWTCKNLDVSTFRNGDVIPEVKNAEQWKFAGTNKIPAWCYYEFNESNGKIYGKLYNWYAVSDSRGLAPNGYHIPSYAEWMDLTCDIEGEDVVMKLKSKYGWSRNNNGDNSCGFNGLPGGHCGYDGDFGGLTIGGYFWSSSEENTTYAFNITLWIDMEQVLFSDAEKTYGFSIRCIRD